MVLGLCMHWWIMLLFSFFVCLLGLAVNSVVVYCFCVMSLYCACFGYCFGFECSFIVGYYAGLLVWLVVGVCSFLLGL